MYLLNFLVKTAQQKDNIIQRNKCYQIDLKLFSLQCTTKFFMQLQWANFCQKAPKSLIMAFLVLQTRGYLTVQCNVQYRAMFSAVQCLNFTLFE